MLLRIPVRLLAFLGALWILLAVTPLVPWWAQWLSAGFFNEPTPVLVVLAGDSLNEETLGYSSYLRCVYAARFWHEHSPRQIILSGGPADHPVSAVMAEFLVSMGVPAERITLETRSTNTRQNLAELKPLLVAQGPVTLLTSDYHMRRAMRIARRTQLQFLPHPVPDAGKRAQANRWERPGIAIELSLESLKLLRETFF